MNLWLRLLRVVFKSFFAKKIHPLEESRVTFKVWPHDCDLNFHLNNGRYLTLMDLGRLYLMAQVGVVGKCIRRKWFPVVGAVEINFKSSLDPFMKFEIVTKLLTWDEKWMYLEQRFERKGVVYATALLKALFLGPKGRVSSADMIALVEGLPETPPKIESIRHWQKE